MQLLSKSYIAGFFDGEGSVSLVTGQPIRLKQGNYWPVLQCTLAQVCPLILCQIQKSYGGYLHFDRSTKRGCWKWCISSAKAEKFLRDLEPYLIGKRAEARAALCFRKTFRKSSRRLTKTEARKRQTQVDRFQKLRAIIRSATFPK